jgi:hypothetical protein
MNIRKQSLAVILSLTLALAACSTNWVTEATNILAVVTPAAVNVLTLISAFSGRPVNQSAAMTITNDVNVAITLIKDYAAASDATKPGVATQLNAALAVTQRDLSIFLSTAGIKDQKKIAEVQAIISFVVSEVAAVQSLIPTATAPPTARKLPISARQFKRNFNSLVQPLNPSLVLK